ncbi:zf-RING_2 domain-containing protein [Cephalotus follicularis]|uniref:Zf-RING_2 domain-containing protein n=1 Tax=Cephalotus follicularis TaxID=3775 RepID=A0A1Q3C5Y3_CEPFO|nr:zf-RING_2 domain-containing protein [Cephalotus follicularis]
MIMRELCSSTISLVIYRLFYAIFNILFAVAGATLGAIIGMLVGLKTRSRIVYGPMIGAVKGGVLSTEIFKFSLCLCHSNDSAISCFLNLVVYVLVSSHYRLRLPQIFQVKVPSISGLVLACRVRTDTLNNDVSVACDKEAWDSLEKIPKIRITDKNIEDILWHRICCSVCLQDIQVGDLVRSLPECHHMFHLPCIDKWLTLRRSCPLCRRTL